MTKLLFILLLLGMGFTQNRIENITESYDNGMPKEIKYYKSISKKLKLTMIKEYYENGQMKSVESYNGQYSEKVYFYEDGSMDRLENYKDGELIDNNPKLKDEKAWLDVCMEIGARDEYLCNCIIDKFKSMYGSVEQMDKEQKEQWDENPEQFKEWLLSIIKKCDKNNTFTPSPF